jgi:diguanylate cyclase (GGDEF)-like protein/PAS domain S-box-containing protein
MNDKANPQRNPCVLVVDDDETSRLLACASLEKAGFTVREADNGRTAIESLAGQIPDIVLLDVMMPEMDGFETCTALRARPETEHVPVVMLTGREDTEAIDRAYRVGATDFATKPINYPLLAHRIRYILRTTAIAAELRSSEARLANAQRIARIGHVEWDVQEGRVYCSPQVYELLGLEKATEVVSDRDFLRYIHPRDRRRYASELNRAKRAGGHYSLEHRIVRKDKSVRIIYQEGEIVFGPRGAAIAATLQDITERRRMERRVLRMENFDAVTRLPNRQFMQRFLGEAIADAHRRKGVVVVMAVDVDHFARINDTLGHGTGDEVLKAIATRLLSAIKPSSAMVSAGEVVQPDGDLLARTAGDEFVLVLTEIESIEVAGDVARRLMSTLAQPIAIGDHEVSVSASIGISGFPVDSMNADELLQGADTALHHAKERGRNCWAFSSSTMNERAATRFKLETDLRKALAAGQFEVHYQPKVSTRDESCTGVEALLRWRHPERGLIPPVDFIPIAEDTRLIVPISEWVIQEACRQVQQWKTDGVANLTVAVNVSSLQFRDSGLHLVVADALRTSGIDPEMLELELTESMLMEDSDRNIRTMQRLRTLGISLSIDDFGTGYSSLGYLKRFPVNTLKIDRAFVRELEKDESDRAIAGGIIGLAHNLHLKVVAEGVETQGQIRLLREMNCDQIQGFYYCKPLPPAELVEWLRARSQPGVTFLPRAASSA